LSAGIPVKRAAIYSSTGRSRGGRASPVPGAAEPPTPAHEPGAGAAGVTPASTGRGRAFLKRHASFFVFLAGSLFALALLVAYESTHQQRHEFTQEDVDAAVLNTLENQSLPSRPARAAEAVLPSVVRVRGYVDDGGGELVESATGSGVVIVDQGIILTNLHVVHGAEEGTVTFFDGMEAEAAGGGGQAENSPGGGTAKNA